MYLINGCIYRYFKDLRDYRIYGKKYDTFITINHICSGSGSYIGHNEWNMLDPTLIQQRNILDAAARMSYRLGHVPAWGAAANCGPGTNRSGQWTGGTQRAGFGPPPGT